MIYDIYTATTLNWDNEFKLSIFWIEFLDNHITSRYGHWEKSGITSKLQFMKYNSFNALIKQNDMDFSGWSIIFNILNVFDIWPNGSIVSKQLLIKQSVSKHDGNEMEFNMFIYISIVKALVYWWENQFNIFYMWHINSTCHFH